MLKNLWRKKCIFYLGGDDPVLYETANEAIETEGHLNYLRYITGRNPSTSVGFKLNNQEYYLIGGDNGDSYQSNKAILDSAFGASKCKEGTTGALKHYECKNEIFEAGSYDSGYVYAKENESNWRCDISSLENPKCVVPDPK